MNFVKALECLLPVVDSVYERWVADRDALSARHAAHPEAPRITCTKGCGACCHFPVIPATAGEAFIVLARLLAEGQSLEELRAKCIPYASRYLEHARRRGSLPLTDEQQHIFLNEKLPCPLFVSTPATGPLGGHCGIFNARPLICDFYHSLETPELCLLKKPHASFADVVERGHQALDDIRSEERKIFGRSTLGHLPLLLAALLTEDGMNAFLKVVEPSEGEENSQDIEDFSLYMELIACLGYQWGEGEWDALAKAQSEMI
jgi:Fe-S-cluster containining protein